jgi:hypothetical protein
VGASNAAAGQGVIASQIGSRWADKQRKGAGDAGIEIGNPGAVAVTPSSLVTMKVNVSAMGAIKAVTEVLSARRHEGARRGLRARQGRRLSAAVSSAA